MHNRTLVVMPTYNEISNLEHAVADLFASNSDIDLLIVDDNSPDGTAQLADKLAANHERIKVLHRESKQGLGPAYLAAFNYAFEEGYEFVVEMDADGSHRAIDLPKLVTAAKTHDLVIGSRWVTGGAVINWPINRKLISRLGNSYVRLMLGVKIKDMTAGFRIYRIEFLRKLDLQAIASQGYSFQVEMAWRSTKAGAKIVEVPITFIERELGYSKMSIAIVIEALWLVTNWGFSRLFGK